MILSISGVPGSGKTSVAKILAKRLGVTFYSIGGLRGKMALERGMTIDELNKIGEIDATTDTPVDDYQRELGKTEDNFVIEGRLSWHFIPHSYKIFLQCELREAARRIYLARHLKGSEERSDEPLSASVKDAEHDISARMASDDLRYKKYYGVNYRDPSQYDLILDTTAMHSAEETVEVILAHLPSP